MKKLALLVVCAFAIAAAAAAAAPPRGRPGQSQPDKKSTVNVAGKWTMTLDMSMGTANPGLELKQEGTKITGTYTGRYGAFSLEGTLKDRTIQFSFVMGAEGQIPDDFYRDAHRKIYNALINLTERDEPADLVTLTNELRKLNQLDPIGGASYIASLIDSVPTAANIEYYAKIVKEKAILRKLIQTSTEIITQSYDDRGDVETFIDEAERAILDF